jgi:release factor glutamine methyltransferase
MNDPLLAWAVDRLKRAGVGEPRREALMLAEVVLGRPRESLYRDGIHFSPEQANRFRALVERRSRREPIAYLTGHREFYGLDLAVTPAVLVPRPETETLVDWALRHVCRQPGRVVDVGCGSGAVGLALAHVGPKVWTIEAVDIDPEAVELTRRNAVRLGLPVTVYRSDLTAAVEPGCLGLLANLPYVDPTAAVDPEVRFEPAHAVFAPEGGLGLIRRLVTEAPDKLAPGGVLGLEVGVGQAEVVAGWLAVRGFRPLPAGIDLQGQVRVVGGEWSGGHQQ